MVPTPDPGLCASCRYHRIIENRRGSRFWLCARSRTDPSFPRYPGLPVLACRGYEPGDPTDTEEAHGLLGLSLSLSPSLSGGS